MRNWKDRLGIVASVVCAVHCAATPILLASLPALKFTEWMASPAFHQIAAVVCSLLVASAIWPVVYRHRDYRMLSVSTAGLALIVTAAFCLPDSCCSKSISAGSDGELHSHDAHDHDAHAGHTHAGHSHSHSDFANADSSDESEHAHSNTLAIAGIGVFQPWMTPIGGVLLILAHGMNLYRGRKRCHGQCKCSHSHEEHSADTSDATPSLVSFSNDADRSLLARAS